PHWVFPATRLTPRAVSSYLAFSPLPALFSKNRRYLLCDTFRQRSLSKTPPAYSTRHAAVWCSDFPLANLATHQRSSAITCSLPRSATKEREAPIWQHSPAPTEDDPPNDSKRRETFRVRSRKVGTSLHLACLADYFFS